MLNLKIVSPEKVEYAGDVESITMPGVEGAFQVLQNHAPIISILKEGAVVYDDKDGQHQLPIESGFVVVQKNKVSLCVEKPS